MGYQTLISTDELSRHIGDPDWVIVDCRFSLDAPQSGRQEYLKAHIAGAVYAHLDEDLSGKMVIGETGRHPLPPIDEFVETLSSWGIWNRTQVIAYDDCSGAIAARLWWMLNWMGHEKVAVLDGGWRKWVEENLPIRTGLEKNQYKEFEADLQSSLNLTAEIVEQIREDPGYLLVDARARERFEGKVEPIDLKAGHIPGAVCVPFEGNVDDRGLFRSRGELRARFAGVLAEVPTENVVCYCGSGVTAAHNLLALAHAGMGMGKLYSGSWSEWITDPRRPVS